MAGENLSWYSNSLQHKNGPIRFQAINEGNYVLHIGLLFEALQKLKIFSRNIYLLGYT